jgi:uncharacterized protein (TIRG00374 family)
MVFVALRDRIEYLCVGPGDLIFLHTVVLAPVVFVRWLHHYMIGEPSDPREERVMKWVRLIGIAAGIAVAVFLVHQVGWASIRHTMGLLGWSYGIVLAYPLTWIVFNTAGWRRALHQTYAKIPLFRLAGIRLAGETFNSLLPSGYIGGEPLKAKLLSGHVPLSEATSSVLIAKASQSIALVLFLGLGLTVGKVKGPSPLTQRGPLTAIVLLSAGIGIFTVLLAKGSFSRLGIWLHHMTKIAWLQKQEDLLIKLDLSIGAFYREGKARFLMSIIWHGAGWLAGALEVAVIFYLIGTPVDWRQAWFISAMGQLGAIIGFMAPAGVGLFEGGHYMAASMLGLPPALGLSVSLIRRVRELFWDLIGLFLFWKLSKVEKV